MNHGKRFLSCPDGFFSYCHRLGFDLDVGMHRHLNIRKVASLWFLITDDLEIGKMDDFVDLTVVGGKIVYLKPDARLSAGERSFGAG